MNDIADLRCWWNEHGQTPEDARRNNGERDPARIEATLAQIRPFVPERVGARVLDFGCGLGRLLIPLALEFPKVRFTGVDLSDKILEHARLAVAAAGLGNVDFANTVEPFDFIYAVLVFQHTPWKEVEAEIHHLAFSLAPGGRLRFQFVPGDSAEFLSNAFPWSVVVGACEAAGLIVDSVEVDPVIDVWSWVTASKPKPPPESKPKKPARKKKTR